MSTASDVLADRTAVVALEEVVESEFILAEEARRAGGWVHLRSEVKT